MKITYFFSPNDDPPPTLLSGSTVCFMVFFTGYYTFSQSMTVEAVVTEVLTDNEMRDTESFTVYDTDFKAMVVEPLPIYFDGTPDYSFQVIVDKV